MNQDDETRSYGYTKNQKVAVQPPRRGWRLFLTILFSPVILLWILFRAIFRKKGSLKQILKLTTTIILIGVVLLISYSLWISRNLGEPDQLTDRKVQQSTKIYDRTGKKILYEFFNEEKRTVIDIEEIPQLLIDGVIATEDTLFYEHKGIRPFSIIRAFVTGVFTKKRVVGASTLTQQLVKNTLLTNERKLSRKIKEAILSVRLEQKFTKKQILEIYFNEIPYGSTNYGISSASHSYYGKAPKDLTLEQIATLAGIPKAPSTYLNNPEKLRSRRNFVLNRMITEGYITKEVGEEAMAEELTLQRNLGEITAPHFVFYVHELLGDKFTEKEIDTGGFSVITTLDIDLQSLAESAVRTESERLFESANANNAGLLAINPKNGEILAMVGSRDYFDKDINGSFNVTTQARRQPGSSFKPIIYTAAFEKGYTPETVLFDVETNFSTYGDEYKPLNYDLKEHGLVTMRKALQGSLNIPAVKTLYLVGEKKSIEFAERLGYTTLSQGNFGLSLVLGGGEVSMLEHVSAYGTIANRGLRHEPTAILKITNSRGDIVYENKLSVGKRVLEESIADTTNNILSDDNARAYAFGAHSILTLGDRPVATKTGTTNSYVDAWTVGYTPSLVTGVWAGNTNNNPMKRGYGGSKVAAPIWNTFMREALKDTLYEEFAPAPINTAEKAILRGSESGGITLKVNKVTNKLTTSSTPPSYIVERTFIPPHTILHYIDKDDPRGQVPEDPTIDPQYILWENALADWIRRNIEKNPKWEVSFEEPPTNYDDTHSLELIPTLTVVHPTPSSTLYSRQIDTDIRVSAPRGVTQVSYKLDNMWVGVVREHPFNLNYNASSLESGYHELTIIIEDDVGNRLEDIIPFLLDAGITVPSVYFDTPPSKLVQEDFPRVFHLKPFKIEEIDSITITAIQNNFTNQITEIQDFKNLFLGKIQFTWQDYPGNGLWTIVLKTKLNNGSFLPEEEIRVKIE
jgi:1A family penicillin-binding protein